MRYVGKAIAFCVVLAIGVIAYALSPVVFVVVLVFGFLGLIGWMIGSEKGRSCEGFFLGLLFGPLGLLVAAVMGPSEEVQAERDRAAAAAVAVAVSQREPHDDTRNCPWCAETIKAAAIVCRFCGRDVSPADSR